MCLSKERWAKGIEAALSLSFSLTSGSRALVSPSLCLRDILRATPLLLSFSPSLPSFSSVSLSMLFLALLLFRSFLSSPHPLSHPGNPSRAAILKGFSSCKTPEAPHVPESLALLMGIKSTAVVSGRALQM